jgi:DNA-binding transcriptional ArsR family regulator
MGEAVRPDHTGPLASVEVSVIGGGTVGSESKTQPTSAAALAVAELFEALAHPARARVLEKLALGPASVPDLCRATGLKAPHLAVHLTRLRAQRLITGHRTGGLLLYALSFPEIVGVLEAAKSALLARAGAGAEGAAHYDGGAAGRNSEGGSVLELVEESIPVLERSLAVRALIAEAVRAVSTREGGSHDEALARLLAVAREQERTLAQVALDVVSGQEDAQPGF